MYRNSFLVMMALAIFFVSACDESSDETADEAPAAEEDTAADGADEPAVSENPRCEQFMPDATATGEGFGCFIQNFGFGACVALVGDWTEDEARAQCNSLDEADGGCLMANVFCDRNFIPAGLPMGAGGSAACIDWDVADADGNPQEGKHQVTFGGTPEAICTSVAGGDQWEPVGDGWPEEILPYERAGAGGTDPEPEPEPEPEPTPGDAGVPDASI